MKRNQGPQDYYKQKSWCDAKDSLGVWRVGRIKRRQKNIITVYFDGWSEKWKQSYCIHSSLIAPFRMHSIGYTGQVMKPLRDWDFNEDSIKTSEGIMTILTHGNFSGLSPYELTLFLRGDLYMQVDCLLNYTYANPAKEISRVIEFFTGILDMVIKWMIVVQNEYKNCDLENPGMYLNSYSDAVYKAGYEVIDTLNSIFGFEERTARFYEKYKQFCSPKVLFQTFIAKEGVKHFINSIKVLGLSYFWHFIINVPAVFSISTAAFNDRYILSLTQNIINQIEVISSENASLIAENPEKILKFMKNIENMIDLVSSPHQKKNYMDFFRNFFQLGKGLNSREIDTENLDSARISLMSPRNKPPLLITPRRGAAKTLSPVKKSENLRFEYSDSNENISALKELIEKRHEECLKLIENKLNNRKSTEENLEIVFAKHHSCDQQEFALLNTIEFLLSENNLEEALKVIRWRKKVLKISALNGWDVAEEVSKRTWEKLDISVTDIIEANLKLTDTSDKTLT